MSRIQDKMKRVWRSAFYLSGQEKNLYNQKEDGDLILMFHNILPETRKELNLRNLGSYEFEKIIRYISNHFDVVPLKQMIDVKGVSRRIAITFDDGLVNNLRHALPVLKQHNIPATFFICTSWLHGISSLWPDTLNRLLMRAGNGFYWNDQKFVRTYMNQFRDKQSNIRLEEILLNMPQEKIDELLQFLIHNTEYDPAHDLVADDEWRIMKGEEIKILSNDPLVTIGSHGITHRNLALLDEQAVDEEFSESKNYLEQVTGNAIDVISFPFGSYHERMLEQSVQCGYNYLIGVNPEVKNRDTTIRVYSRLGLYNDSSVTENLHKINSFFE